MTAVVRRHPRTASGQPDDAVRQRLARLRLRARLPELALPPDGWPAPPSRVGDRAAMAGIRHGAMAGDIGAISTPHLRLNCPAPCSGNIAGAVRVCCYWLGARADARKLLAVLSGSALALVSVTGHAAAASPAGFTAIGIVNDACTCCSGGFWIGGLMVLARSDRSRTRRGCWPALRAVRRLGDVAVALLALTGLLNAATIILGGEGPAADLSGGAGGQAGAGAGDGGAGADQSFPPVAASGGRRGRAN